MYTFHPLNERCLEIDSPFFLIQRSEEELLEKFNRFPGKFPYLFCIDYPGLISKILNGSLHLLEQFCPTIDNILNVIDFWISCAQEKPKLLPSLFLFSCHNRNMQELELISYALQQKSQIIGSKTFCQIVRAASLEFIFAAPCSIKYFFKENEYEEEARSLIRMLDKKTGTELLDLRLCYQVLPLLKKEHLLFIHEMKGIHWMVSHLSLSYVTSLSNEIFVIEHYKSLWNDFDVKKIELNDCSFYNFNFILDSIGCGKIINLNYLQIKSISSLLEVNNKFNSLKNHKMVLHWLYKYQFETVEEKYRAMWEGWLQDNEIFDLENLRPCLRTCPLLDKEEGELVEVEFLLEYQDRRDLKLLMTYALKIIEKVNSQLACDPHSLSTKSQIRLLRFLFQSRWENIPFPEEETSLLNVVMPLVLMLVKEKMVSKLLQESSDLIIETKEGSFNCHRAFIEPIFPALFSLTLEPSKEKIKIPLSSVSVKYLLDKIYNYKQKENNPHHLDEKITLTKWIKLLEFCSKMGCDPVLMEKLEISHDIWWSWRLGLWWEKKFTSIDQLSKYFEVFKDLLMNAEVYERLNFRNVQVEIFKILFSSTDVGITPMVELFKIATSNESNEKKQVKAYKAWGACWRICFVEHASRSKQNESSASVFLGLIMNLSEELSNQLSIPFSTLWSRDILPHLQIEARAVILAECYKSLIHKDSIFTIRKTAEEIWNAYWPTHAEISSSDVSKLLSHIKLLLPTWLRVDYLKFVAPYKKQFNTLEEKYQAMWIEWLEDGDDIYPENPIYLLPTLNKKEKVGEQTEIEFSDEQKNRTDLKILMTYAVKIIEKARGKLTCNLYSLSEESQRRLLKLLFRSSWENVSFPKEEILLLNIVMPTILMLVEEKKVSKLLHEICDLTIKTQDGTFNCHRAFIEPIFPSLFSFASESIEENIEIPLPSVCVKYLFDWIYGSKNHPYLLTENLLFNQGIKLLEFCFEKNCDPKLMYWIKEAHYTWCKGQLDSWWLKNYTSVEELSIHFEVFKNLLMNAAAYERLNVTSLQEQIHMIMCGRIQGKLIGISLMVELFQIWASNENKKKIRQKAYEAWGACWRNCFGIYAACLKKDKESKVNTESAARFLHNKVIMSLELSDKLSIPFSIFWSRDIMPHLPMEAKAVILSECYKSIIDMKSAFDERKLAEEIWNAYWPTHAEISSYDVSELLEHIELLLPEGKKIDRHEFVDPLLKK